MPLLGNRLDLMDVINSNRGVNLFCHLTWSSMLVASSLRALVGTILSTELHSWWQHCASLLWLLIDGGLGNGNISIDFWGCNEILKEESVEREITMHVDICQHLSANKYPAIEVGYG